jgi:hypothetical protein
MSPLSSLPYKISDFKCGRVEVEADSLKSLPESAGLFILSYMTLRIC